MHLQWQLDEPLIFSDWFLFPVTSPHLLSLILLVFLVIICLIFSGCKFLEKRLLPVSFPLSLKLRRGLYYSGCSGWRMSEWKPKSQGSLERKFEPELKMLVALRHVWQAFGDMDIWLIHSFKNCYLSTSYVPTTMWALEIQIWLSATDSRPRNRISRPSSQTYFFCQFAMWVGPNLLTFLCTE